MYPSLVESRSCCDLGVAPDVFDVEPALFVRTRTDAEPEASPNDFCRAAEQTAQSEQGPILGALQRPTLKTVKVCSKEGVAAWCFVFASRSESSGWDSWLCCGRLQAFPVFTEFAQYSLQPAERSCGAAELMLQA